MDRYILDKRTVKKNIKKYAIIFGVIFVVLILFNIFLSQFEINKTLKMVLLCVFGALVWIMMEVWMLAYKKSKQEKLEMLKKHQKTVKKQNSIIVQNKNAKSDNIENKSEVKNNKTIKQ